MTYSNPIATIASIGASNTPIPVVIESVIAPTSRPNNVPLRPGDIWWEPVNKIQYLYLTVDENGGPGWQPVAGEGYIQLVENTVPDYILPPATGTTIGGIIVGPGLDVATDGTLTLEPNEDFQNITVHQSATLHTITTGADVTTGVAINASAGEITAKWLNIANNPTPDTSDVNYGMGLRTTGRIVCGEITPTSVTGAGSVVANTVNVSILSGARQGLVYKLQAGDGMTFEGSIHSHIGGTVGNDYHTNVGTLGVDNSVLRNTGTQTINGDINMTSAGPAGGNINMNTIKFKLNYSNSNQIGDANVGHMAFINNAPAYANGTEWVSLAGVGEYTLPPATSNTLGGIRVGSNLSIDAEGILTADCLTTATGGSVTQGNIILENGYFRANRAAADDVVIEGREDGSLNYLVMASGSVAIGGIIDESATQANSNIFLNKNGQAKFTGKVQAPKHFFNQNFTDASSAGNPDLGTLAMIAGTLYFGTGTEWKEISLGPSLNLE
jgi:hypothetical protein